MNSLVLPLIFKLTPQLTPALRTQKPQTRPICASLFNYFILMELWRRGRDSNPRYPCEYV